MSRGEAACPLLYGDRGISSVVHRFTWALLMLFFLQSTVSSASPVQGKLQKTLLGLGETVSLEIMVKGTIDGAVHVDVPRVSGLRIAGPQTSKSSQTSIINGRVESSVTTKLVYQVTALKEGTYVIPSFQVTANGERHSVGPFRLKVKRSPESDQIKLKARIDKVHPFIQEPVDYRVALYFATDVGDYSFTVPALEPTEDTKVEILAPPKGGETGELVVGRMRVPVSITRETLDGVEYAVYTVRMRLYPLRSGKLTLMSPFLRASLRVGSKMERDFFGFTQRVPKYQTITTAARAIVLEVQPLPSEGRPRGFSGAVGAYGFSVEADETEVRVGDPIRLTMTVTGKGLLDQIPRIDLTVLPNITKAFSVLETLEPGEVMKNRVVFEQVVRARSDTVSLFPAIPFTYFDTGGAKYRSAWSKPIALNVSAAPGMGLLKEFGMAESTGRHPAETTEGLRALFRGPELVKQTKSPWVPLAWLLFAPGGYLVVLVVVVARRRFSSGNEGWRRRRTIIRAGKAFRRIDRLIDEPSDDFFSELANTCAEQVSVRLGIGKGEVTVHDVPNLVERKLVSPETAEELNAFLEDLDALRFSPMADEIAQRAVLLEKARAVIPKVKTK